MDRLAELKSNYNPQNEVAIQITADQSPLHGTTSNLNEFLNDVEIVQRNIHLIAESSLRIQEIDQRMLLASSNDKEIAESQQLNDIIKVTNKKAALTKKLLQVLRDSTNEAKTKGSVPSNEIRVKENHINTLTRKFVDVMKDYQLAQSKYKSDLTGKVRRQVQVIKPDVTNEEIDAIMKSGDGTSNALRAQILEGDAADVIVNATQNVKDKYQDVLALEKSVQELHQMFLDFALMTEQQSELLDQIEYQVKDASEFIDKGNEELTKAIELAISLRKKQCCCCMLVFFAVAILVGIILASIASKGGLK